MKFLKFQHKYQKYQNPNQKSLNSEKSESLKSRVTIQNESLQKKILYLKIFINILIYQQGKFSSAFQCSDNPKTLEDSRSLNLNLINNV